MIFSQAKECRFHKKKTSMIPVKEEEAGCKRCHISNINTLFKDGMDIVLRLHQIGSARVEKTQFKSTLDMLKLSEKWKYEFLYTDFE